MLRFFKIFMLIQMMTIFSSCNNDDDVSHNEGELLDPVEDIAGNEYEVRKIGDQIWMVENLRTDTYNDGSMISEITDPSEWFNGGQPGFSWYGNEPTANSEIFGALYNWDAVDTDKLCPDGWHIPTLEEFTELIDYVGGEANAGNYLKSTDMWEEPSLPSTDSYDFTAFPTGFRSFDGIFQDRYYETAFWTSSKENAGNDYSDDSAWTITFRANSPSGRNFSRSVKNGYSCRCIKD